MLIPFLSDVCIEGAVLGRRQSLVGFLNCLVDLFLKVLPDESNEVAIAPVCDVGTIRLSYRVAGRINICRSNLRSRSALCHGMKRTWPDIATDSRSLVGSYQSSLVFIRNSLNHVRNIATNSAGYEALNFKSKNDACLVHAHADFFKMTDSASSVMCDRFCSRLRCSCLRLFQRCLTLRAIQGWVPLRRRKFF